MAWKHVNLTTPAQGLRACYLFLSLAAVLTTTPAASLAQTPAPGLKLRQIAEQPQDHVGKVFTYTVWLSTSQQWMKRARWGDYYISLEDLEGNKYPGDTGYDPAWELHSLRFVLPKDQGNALISQHDPTSLPAHKCQRARARQGLACRGC